MDAPCGCNKRKEKRMSFGKRLKSLRDEYHVYQKQLADYLNVARSAMSNELGKMQKDRMIEVDRKHFRILGEMEI